MRSPVRTGVVMLETICYTAISVAIVLFFVFDAGSRIA